MNAKDRLLEFLRYLDIGQNKFESIVGISNGYINNNKGSLGTKIMEKIAIAYPDLNTVWLTTGEGEMVKRQDRVSDVGATYSLLGDRPRGVPYYENVEGTCGIVPQYNDYPETPTFFINYEHFNDCTAYLPVVGDSMYPQYCAGEIIAVKRIFNMDIIQWGEAYFVVTNDNANALKTVKLVHPHDDPNKIILRASNPNFRGDTLINKSDIISMFIIKGKIKRNQL